MDRTSQFVRVVGAVLVSLSLFAGCATIPVEQCGQVNWFELGVKDGQSGFGVTRVDRHRQACAPVGVLPDFAAWEAGRQQGLGDYCQLSNAITQGLSRHAYEGVCPGPEFALLHDAARSLGEARYQIEMIDRELDALERELLDGKKLSDARRAELRAEIRALERRRDRARDDRGDAERTLDRLRSELGV